MAILKIRGLHKKFISESTIQVLKGVGFEVKKGQHVFIIGETGSGKSTLLKVIFGLHIPEKGAVWLNNEKLQFENQLITGFDGMKLVEQDFNLKKFNTVRSAIESKLEIGLNKKQKQNKTNELLDLFQLRKLAPKQILQNSGGQQQRVALAQAFANLPQVLLLDEPFAHLDPQLKTNIFRYINNCIVKNGLTVLTVTHDFMETLKHADWVIALEKGKIAQEGEPKELYEKPVNKYIAGLLGSFSELKVDDKTWLLRPENIILEKKGDYEGEILSLRYGGNHYEVEINYDKQVLITHFPLNNSFAAGDKIRFNLELKREVIDQFVFSEQ